MRRASKLCEEICLTQDGFKLLRNRQLVFHVEWHDVTGIAAFKQDLFAVDEICLAFRTRELDYPYVTESMIGYDALLDEINRRYPDLNRDWWSKVAFPAFQLCWTVVWGDAPQPIECPRCGYDLRGAGNFCCPECGETLPPDVCPDCSGRGRYRFLHFLCYGLGAVAVGLVLFICQALLPGLPAFVRTLLMTAAGTLTLLGGIAVFVNLTDMHVTCPRCGGNGRIKKNDA